ncbi:MAG: HAD family phosphatase [Pirellulales bacterium]|nr:HAD family phosphatase [Pirellulales bacterium]
MKYRLLAIDIDGTLMNSRDELTPGTQAALVRASAAGVQVVLATGRRYRRALPLVEPLGIDVPLITASGALVKDPLDHRTIYRAEFDSALLRGVCRFLDRAGFDPLLCADTFHQRFDFFHAVEIERIRHGELAEYLEINPDDGRLLPDLLDRPPPDAFLAFTFGTREQMLALESALRENFPGRLATHVLRSPRYRGFLVEIVPAEVSKWSAVRRLARSWNIAEREICAVGDDVNDLTMIRAAGLGVAMGNAIPEVKAAADRIAPTHDEEGLVQVVQWII